MKTKVLVVPTLIVLSGFIALNYIKPDLDTYLQKRAERDVAEDHALQAENISKNVAALKSEIDTKKDNVAFVKRYLPAEKDEGRMIDSMNFLTGQAGLLTSRIQMQKVEDDSAEGAQTFGTSIDPVADADPLTKIAVDPTTGLPLANAVVPYKAPKVEKYLVSLEALGGYSSMKDLLKKFQGFDRLQEVQSFKIALGDGSATDTEGSSSGTLVLTYNAILPFQKTPAELTGESIVTIPGLTQSSFDFTPVDTLKTTLTDTVPDTVLGTDGKANPFE